MYRSDLCQIEQMLLLLKNGDKIANQDVIDIVISIKHDKPLLMKLGALLKKNLTKDERRALRRFLK